MQTIPKCFLLPMDGTGEALRPAKFLGSLYEPSRVRLILSYFSTPPPFAFSGALARSSELREKKRRFFEQVKADERRVFETALETLAGEGFSKDFIQEHVEPRQMSVAKQTCLLGDIRKVDAIVISKHVNTNLEDLMKSDPSSALARYCIECPVWLVRGKIDPGRAAICVKDEKSSMRIADHAAYMLYETDTQIDLLAIAGKNTRPVSCRPAEAAQKLTGSAEAQGIAGLVSAFEILSENGIAEERIRMTLLADRGDRADEILSWCVANGIGILGLGRPRTEGILSYLKNSATAKIASDFKNMAIWIA